MQEQKYLETKIEKSDLIKMLKGFNVKHKHKVNKIEIRGDSLWSIVWVETTKPNQSKQKFDLYFFSVGSFFRNRSWINTDSTGLNESIWRRQKVFFRITSKSVSRQKMVSFFQNSFPDRMIDIIQKMDFSGNYDHAKCFPDGKPSSRGGSDVLPNIVANFFMPELNQQGFHSKDCINSF